MLVSPLPGYSADTIHSALCEVATDATNMHHGGGTPLELFNGYLEWAAKAVAVLGAYFRESDVEALVCSQRYWALQSLDPATKSPSALAHLVHAEAHAAADRLADALAELDSAVNRWQRHSGTLVVLDTNVYCNQPETFDQTNWNEVLEIPTTVHLVMPLVVVDELDRLKRVHEVKAMARATLRAVDRHIDSPCAVAEILPSFDGQRFTFELLLDQPGHTRMERADDEIVDRTADLAALASRPVTFVTYDTGARIRARLADLPVLKLD